MTSTSIETHAPILHCDGYRYRYRVECSCGESTIGYASEQAAFAMHDDHVALMRLLDVITVHTGGDPLGLDAEAFSVRLGTCEACGALTHTAFVSDTGGERRVCVGCVAF